MKKSLVSAALLLTMGAVLAACGTSESTENASSTPPETSTKETAGKDVADKETDSNENVAEETTDEENAVEEAPPEEAVGEEASSAAEGTLAESDEQPYELNVLPGYVLTSEEPGKDSLYKESDPSAFMRIETFAPGEIDFSQAETQVKETLKAVNAEAEIAEGQALAGAGIVKSSRFEVPSAEGKVTGVVIEQENQLVRLTIFDSEAANATADLIAMGQTIKRTE
ncbi:hypothetical protein HF394_01010 [Planococcus glaciei]|uniref:Lipoprotein n=1 Tax=Planococcus glaciei TaxID=459472 RepID=A0A7H8Q5Q1_9BACL|nr:hypothetical protein [Planococcus glaciei]ETP68565.1 hypothetical protein G159_11720 [Planococcus glaciei CHR43]QDY44618.1 hypothetical protein FK545_01050 [Planococcus glaciei]QKX49264.1 hypothetical protein HF394_01010 [Planococcus glaciei]